MPRLAELSSFVFCTVASAVKSERTFSNSGSMLTDNRSRLGTVISEQLMIVNQNWKD